jgi:23S rRNA (uracil1939-C5)-methyltransferase
MTQEPLEAIEVQLTGWAYGGEALGRAEDGRMVFAPFCMPGERVSGELIEDRARWARILPQEWLQISPDRIEAQCPHFTMCGGCHYQHLTYQQQLTIKAAIVKEQLQRIGGLDDPPVADTIPSPRSWDYRNHMRYQVLPNGSLGLVRFRDTSPFALETCHLPEPDLQDVWSRIDLPKGTSIEQVGIRMGTHGDPMIILHGDMTLISEVEIDFPASIIWQDGAAWRVLAGEGAISFEILEHTFRVSPPSFFQVNSGILSDLVEQVLSALNLESGMNFFDLYAGVGLFSAYASQKGARVFAVEESNSACADFEANLEKFNNVSLYEAPVEVALPAIDASADVILVDPPRAGLSKATLDAIHYHHPEHLVYLSCDLGTLARDAKRLRAGGYQLERVTPVDIFPQTFHIETLSTWQRS